ncbi:MAG: hypothetical protein AAFV01_10915 [Bacteroidota bacterium]
MHTFRHVALVATILLALPTAATAQSLPDWAAPSAAPAPEAFGETPTDATPNPPEVPIDGGLGLLALAGAGYAARRLRQQHAE